MSHSYPSMSRALVATLGALLVVACLAGPALASLTPLDSPAVTMVQAGNGKLAVQVTAGASGAPQGFMVCWMTRSEYVANGYQWYPVGDARLHYASFTGQPTLNTFDGTVTTFQLAPDQAVKVEIGDLFDETGVTTNDTGELEKGVQYIVCGISNGDGSDPSSAPSPTQSSATTSTTNCTYTQGFWKNKPDAWPVGSLTLGSVTYSQAQLLAILGQPAGGNGLISLAHQLIAAKLNILNGADGTVVASVIAAADLQIGALVVPPVGGGSLNPASTSSETQALDDFNNGITGPGHCADVPTKSSTWGQVKSLYR